MDLAVKVICGAIITMWLFFMQLDMNISKQMMTSEFFSNRSSSQGSLYEIQDKYNNREEITTVEMLDNWIINFINTHGVDYEQVNLLFHQIETDPPTYLVTVEGYVDEYAILSGEAYFEYTSGTSLISSERKPEIEEPEEGESGGEYKQEEEQEYKQEE